MDDETLQQFADQLDADSDAIVERWQGRPDLIIDDIFRVRDIDTGEPRDLELFDVQRKVVHAYFYGNAGTLNAYKGRRIGYSFVVVACFLLEAMFYPSSFYPIVSRSKSQAKDRIEDIEELIDISKITIPTEKTNTDYIELWNGSAFMAYSADSDTGRGADSARAVLMDEMAFIEDEESAQRAFGAFLSLGKNRKMVEISTPNTKNDVFMQHNREGSPSGKNGIIALKQPTFKNADEIDIHTSLYEQDLEPARPSLNIDRIETERLADPEGFGQEYLCRPVVDEYRFFDEDAIDRALARGRSPEYDYYPNTPKEHGHRRIVGVDIGINRDDTAISVMDHYKNERYQRAMFIVDDELLRFAGISDPDRGNANHIAQLLNWLQHELDIDMGIMDKGGPGETFERIINEKFGRKMVPFDFSDKESVNDMMGDMNMALHEDRVTLVPDDRLRDELSAIVKEKRDHYSKPKYSGKDNSESGKDDAAIATVLSAFPPKGTGEDTVPKGKPARQPSKESDAEIVSPIQKENEKPSGERFNYGAQSVTRSSRNRSNRFRGKSRRR